LGRRPFERDASFDEVAELTNVARPAPRHEDRDQGLRQVLRLAGEALVKVRGEKGNVFATRT
jgi:hypothetical protein